MKYELLKLFAAHCIDEKKMPAAAHDLEVKYFNNLNKNFGLWRLIIIIAENNISD